MSRLHKNRTCIRCNVVIKTNIMNRINKLKSKYNALTKEEFKQIPYGEHFKYAKTLFKGNITLYVPPRKSEQWYEETDLSQFIPEANLSSLASKDTKDGFRISNNIVGGVY